MRILIIEDDELTAQALTTVLTAYHYAIETARTGRTGLALLESFEYDLLILDIGLPDFNGIELCRQVRKIAQTEKLPILLLTACQSHHDRALGLDAGADDYVVKPFHEEELVARIRALFRRASDRATPDLEWGDLRFTPSTCEVFYHAQPLYLTPKEYELLELFLRNSRRVFSCSTILEHLWAFEDAPGEEAVRTHIKGLRHKLKAAGAPADLIETVYGIGYRLKPLPSGNTPGSIEQELRSKLATVWTRYKDRVNKQLALIEQVASHPNRNQQLLAQQQAHSLAGALGTFGFMEGSHLARELEQVLVARSLNPNQLEHLRHLLATLRRNLDIPASSVTLQLSCPEPHHSSILIVSRDHTLINPLEQEASFWNYDCTIASTPKAALKLCEQDAPSIVMLDLDCFVTPAIGLSWLNTLKQYAPAIVFTSQNELTERLAVARQGGRLLLQKMTPAAQVFDAIAQVLNHVPPTQAKILVVDDDVMILDALTTLLKPWGLHVFTLNDPHCFWEILTKVSPDVLVLDLEFPDLSGIELCQVVRSDLHWKHLPVVMLTAHAEAERIRQAFAAGADDFVGKPIVGAELVARILSLLERTKLVRQFLETDPLTGVLNRQKSTQELEGFLRLSDRTGQSVAIAVIDVDRLRDVNAQYGHAAGDVVLRQFGHLLRQSFQSEDVVARWGGEEFVIGMYSMTREDGVQRLIQVLEQLNQQPWKIEGEIGVQVTFSAGVAQYPEDGRNLKALYCAADAALRQAKRLQIKTTDQTWNSSILPAEITAPGYTESLQVPHKLFLY